MIYKAEFTPISIEKLRKTEALAENDLVHNGITYRGADQVGKLCRVLKEGVLEIYRGEKLQMTITDISKRAERSLQDGANTSFRWAKYTPFSESGIIQQGNES